MGWCTCGGRILKPPFGQANTKPAREQIIDALTESEELLSPTQLQNITGKGAAQIYMNLRELLEEGKIQRPERGRYTVAKESDEKSSQ